MRPSGKLLARLVVSLGPAALVAVACGEPSELAVVDEGGPRKTGRACDPMPGQCIEVCYEKLVESEACLTSAADKEKVRTYLRCSADVNLDHSNSFSSDNPCCWDVGACSASGRALVVGGHVLAAPLERGPAWAPSLDGRSEEA